MYKCMEIQPVRGIVYAGNKLIVPVFAFIFKLIRDPVEVTSTKSLISHSAALGTLVMGS